MPATTATRSQAALASALRVAVMRLSRRLRNEREDTSLTLTQLSTLGTLSRRGPLPLGDLAAAERIQPPSMTRIVSALEERGLVTRAADPADRRLVIVGLAEEGRALLAADRKRRDAWLNRRLRELSGEERAALRHAIPVIEKLAGS